MRQLLSKAIFFFRCVFFLRVTPKGLRLAYADMCLAAGFQPVEIAPDLFLHGDECTSVFLSAPDFDVALNAANYTDSVDIRSYTGISIQLGNLETRKWRTVYRVSPPIFASDIPQWIPLVRTALKAKVKPKVNPIPLTPLRSQ